MTREKIIDIVNVCVLYNANQGTWSIDNRFADKLLALIEQEKKEQVREIFEKLLGKGSVSYNEFTGFWESWCSWEVLKQVAKEYGVEL